MVTPNEQSGKQNSYHGSPYVSRTEGAPPLPPPGGYRGSSRAAQLAAHRAQERASRIETVTLPRPRSRQHWLGWAALGAASVFGLVLGLAAFASPGGGPFTSSFLPALLLVQFLVLALVVASLIVKHARKLGVVALSVALVANIASLGGLSAIHTATSGSYVTDRPASAQQSLGFPGVDGYTEDEILAARSFEEERDEVTQILATVREALSTEYGVTWTQTSDESDRRMRNGLGGESMLYTAYFAGWTTNEPIRDINQKFAMMDTAANVFMRHGYADPYAFNLDRSALPDSQMRNFYGGLTPDTQPLWSSVTWEGWSGKSSIYLEILDFSLDTTGNFQDGAIARQQNPGDPVEGFMLSAIAEPLLKEADRDEFIDRMRDY